MPFHGPVEGLTEQLGPLFDLGRKGNKIFCRDKTQLATDRLIDQYLRLQRVDLSHKGNVEEMDPHSAGPIGHLPGRPGLWVFDAPQG